MDYKLFDDYITLQALLKDLGVIRSGGAAKAFLAENQVFFNGEIESRRGKKLRVGDVIRIEEQALTITIVAPSDNDWLAYQDEQKEKERVMAVVKQLNQKGKTKTPAKDKKVVRFPGR